MTRADGGVSASGRDRYLHGYDERERRRLLDQSVFLEPWIYDGLDLLPAGRLLEIGCGVGAQLRILARRYPGLQLTGLDRETDQLEAARYNLQSEIAAGRVRLLQADAGSTGLPSADFDQVFLCWLVEHLPQPDEVLREAWRLLKPGGMITATEVFNRSLCTVPEMTIAGKFMQALSDLQRATGGDPNAGLKLGNYLSRAGFSDIRLRTLTIMLDAREQDSARRLDFCRYWRALFRSTEAGLLREGLVTQADCAALDVEFQQLQDNRDAVFYVAAMQARAYRM